VGVYCVGQVSHLSTGDWARAFAIRLCHRMLHIGDLVTPLVHLHLLPPLHPRHQCSPYCLPVPPIMVLIWPHLMLPPPPLVDILDWRVVVLGRSRSRLMHRRRTIFLAAWVCIGCGTLPSLRALPFLTIKQDCLDYCKH
jgi:hypothetical protein